MRLVVPEPSPLDRESDDELLLNAVAGDETERRLATAAFFRRYVHAVYGYCQQFQLTLGGEAGVCDLVVMTFQRALASADSFNADGITDQKYARAHTVRWLTTIAKNLLRDWLKSVGEDHPLPLTSLQCRDGQHDGQAEEKDAMAVPRRYSAFDDDAEERHDDPSALEQFVGEEKPPPVLSSQHRCLQKALASLSEREREIVLLEAEYSVDGKQLRLPPEVLEGLCKRWRTNKPNIRAIRKRARLKLGKYVAENC